MNLTVFSARTRAPSSGRAAFDRNPFERYRREELVEVRRADVKEPEMLVKLKFLWKMCRFENEKNETGVEFYHLTMKLLKEHNVSCSADDIKLFCVEIIAYVEERGFSTKSGAFISALINHGTDEDYAIDVRPIDGTINYLCFENIKNVTIYGNLGDYICQEMGWGRVTIHGNVISIGGWATTQQTEGEVIVHGNVENDPAFKLHEGKRVIHGNVSLFVGQFMRGGQLHINGKFPGISSEFEKGRIYHNGELISGNR